MEKDIRYISKTRNTKHYSLIEKGYIPKNERRRLFSSQLEQNCKTFRTYKLESRKDCSYNH